MNATSNDPQCPARGCSQIICNRLALIVNSFILVFFIAAVITCIMPRKYRGRVEMVVVDASSTIGDDFLKAQIAIIHKHKTMDRVLEKLELTKKWGVPTSQVASLKLVSNLDVQSSITSGCIASAMMKIHSSQRPSPMPLQAAIANTVWTPTSRCPKLP